MHWSRGPSVPFFFFNDTATTEIYTLSLHDALPISPLISSDGLPLGTLCVFDAHPQHLASDKAEALAALSRQVMLVDRKSTRLNSSHSQISYAVFCLKKKNMSSTHVSFIRQLDVRCV